MSLRAEDKEAACLFYFLIRRHASRVPPELDVDAAARHVGGDRYPAPLSRLRDDLAFAFVILRVQELVRNALLLEMRGKELVLLDRDGTDKHGLTILVQLFYLARHGLVLPRLRLENLIFRVNARDLFIRRHHDSIETVHFVEFFRGCYGSPRHASQFFIQAEVILEGNRSKGATLLLHRNAFFCFYRLMQPVAPTTPRLHAAGKLIDDHDLPITNHIRFVALVQGLRANGRFKVVH